MLRMVNSAKLLPLIFTEMWWWYSCILFLAPFPSSIRSFHSPASLGITSSNDIVQEVELVLSNWILLLSELKLSKHAGIKFLKKTSNYAICNILRWQKIPFQIWMSNVFRKRNMELSNVVFGKRSLQFAKRPRCVGRMGHAKLVPTFQVMIPNPFCLCEKCPCIITVSRISHNF